MNKNNDFSSFLEKEEATQIETALLGLALVHKKIDSQISQIFSFLTPSHFLDKKNQALFKVMKFMYDSKEKIFDIKLMNEYIKSSNNKNILNIEYINYVIKNAGYLSSLNQYMNYLIENEKKIQLSTSVKKTLSELNTKNSELLIEEIRNELYKIEERKINNEFVEGKDIIEEVINEIFSQKKEISGIKTGFYMLDEITNGLQNGDLIILAARPSVGKTAFALNLALNAMKIENRAVAFFSLEMPAKQLMQRLLSTISGVFNNKLKSNKEGNKLSERDKEAIFEAQEKIKKMKLFIDDSASIKLDEIIWKSRKQKEKNQLDLIIIDYLQLIPTNGVTDNRQQEVSKISRSLKQLARELNVPIIALSQLNRRVELREEKKPLMSDLRESGAIEQDADIIAFLFREEYYSKDKEKKNNIQITELIIAKHRNGSIGNINLSFLPSLGLFQDFNDDINQENK